MLCLNNQRIENHYYLEDDTFHIICDFLPPSDLNRSARVCKLWRVYIQTQLNLYKNASIQLKLYVFKHISYLKGSDENLKFINKFNEKYFSEKFQISSEKIPCCTKIEKSISVKIKNRVRGIFKKQTLTEQLETRLKRQFENFDSRFYNFLSLSMFNKDKYARYAIEKLDIQENMYIEQKQFYYQFTGIYKEKKGAVISRQVLNNLPLIDFLEANLNELSIQKFVLTNLDNGDKEACFYSSRDLFAIFQKLARPFALIILSEFDLTDEDAFYLSELIKHKTQTGLYHIHISPQSKLTVVGLRLIEKASKIHHLEGFSDILTSDINDGDNLQSLISSSSFEIIL